MKTLLLTTLLATASGFAAELAHLEFEMAAQPGLDSSPHVNHATAVNNPVIAAGAGLNGSNALHLTRNTAPGGLQQHLQWIGASHPVVKVLEGDFSFSVWVKPTDFHGTILWSRPPVAIPANGMSLFIEAMDPVFRTDGFFAGPDDLYGFHNLLDGGWHHLVITRRASGEKELWINGELAGISQDLAPADLSQFDIINVGADQLNNTFGYDGYMDELRVFNHALSASEIYLLANPGALDPDLSFTFFLWMQRTQQANGTVEWVPAVFPDIYSQAAAGRPAGSTWTWHNASGTINGENTLEHLISTGGNAATFQPAMDRLLDNPWSLTLTAATPGGPVSRTISFSVNVPPGSVSEAQFPSVTVGAPAWQSLVSPQPSLQWTSPEGPWGELTAWCYNLTPGLNVYRYSFLPVNTTQWTPSPSLPDADYQGFVRYHRWSWSVATVTSPAIPEPSAQFNWMNHARFDFTVSAAGGTPPGTIVSGPASGGPPGSLDLSWLVTPEFPDNLSRLQFAGSLNSWTGAQGVPGLTVTREPSAPGTVRARVSFTGSAPSRAFFRLAPPP